MEFQIDIRGRQADLAALSHVLARLDPSAVADRDPLQPVLRVDTQLTAPELLAALHEAGCEVPPQALFRKPSGCCGGCGG